MNLIVKIIISALLIGGISEIGRRNSALAALLAALPLVSLLSILWIYQETHDVARISEFSWSVFWYVLPSLVFFVLLPLLLTRWQTPFYPALLVAAVSTIAVFLVLKVVVKKFGINL